LLRLIVSGCLAALAACAGSPHLSIAEVAAEYVRLARETSRSDEGYVRALRDLSARVQGLEEDRGRRAFLLAQLAALERRARVIAGHRVTIRAEAAALGLQAPVFDADRAAQLRAELGAALPGAGPVAGRLASYHRQHSIPRANLDSTATRLVSECRARMPSSGEDDGGSIELRYVADRAWPAFATYKGHRRTEVEIRRDVAWTMDDLRVVLCHETYPGHHLQHLVWAELHDRHGWVEFAVTPPFTPLAIMAERSAVTATDLLWPAADRPAIQRVLSDLAPLAAATAVDIVDGQLDRPAGLARLRDELLMPNASEFITFVEQQRSMSLAYVMPAPGIRDWQSYMNLLRSPDRLVEGASTASHYTSP
jgi:hypothetical protein